MKDSTKKFAIGTIFVAAAGYVAGILTAPKSGKETRADIKNAANTAAAETEKQLKKLHTELSQLLNDVKDRGEQLKGKAKDEYNDIIEKSKVAKQKARELLSALHEGDTEDKDLQKAISDADKAINHLKNYLKKPTN